MGGPQFLLVEHGGLERPEGGLEGSSLINLRNFHLPYLVFRLKGGS